jgi:hypothetical protein
MKIFTIENETNNVTVHGTAQAAEAVVNAERFGNEAGLAKLAADWSMARLIEIWNGIPGETPVTRFTDRKTATGRIWKAIQSLGMETATAPEEVTPAPAELADSAPLAAHVAPTEAPISKKASRAKKAPKTVTEPRAPREGSKTSQVIAMLKREGGTTLQEIIAAMGWQKHTTRAMLSAGGSLTRNHGVIVTSEKGWRPAALLDQSLSKEKHFPLRRQVHAWRLFSFCWQHLVD